MNVLAKVFVAATAGTILGAFLEPKITPHLPASISTSPTTGKLVHAGIAGSSGTLIFWALGAAGVGTKA